MIKIITLPSPNSTNAQLPITQPRVLVIGSGCLHYWSFNRSVPRQSPWPAIETPWRYAHHRGQPWQWLWLTTGNHGLHRGKPWSPTESTVGVVVHRDENRLWLNGVSPWKGTVANRDGLQQRTSRHPTADSPVDTHREYRGCPSLAVVQ